TDPAYPGGTYEDVIFQYRNAERLEAKGMEVSVERGLKERWGGFFNFSYSQTKDKQTGLRLINSPEFMANLGLNYQWVKNRFTSSLEFQYVDKRKAYDGQIAGSYVNTNLSFAFKKVTEVLDVSLFIRNLFDVKIFDPIFGDYYPVVLMKQDGRTFNIRVSLNL
ncbi:MAG: TonB-dependent receptor, partial [Candidatus Zixiibacteriota bacterium]